MRDPIPVMIKIISEERGSRKKSNETDKEETENHEKRELVMALSSGGMALRVRKANTERAKARRGSRQAKNAENFSWADKDVSCSLWP